MTQGLQIKNYGPVVITPAPDDDGFAIADTCTAKQEMFALAWAKTGNKSAAYRMSFDVHPRTLPFVVWKSAQRVSDLPQVAARFKVLLQQATLETIMSVRELLQLQVDIATADPTELIKVVRRNCRYCRGHDYKYQWRDIGEYIDAVAKSLDDKKPEPSDDGGFDFNGALEPVPECPHCYGVGTEQTLITPTDQLVGKAKKLFAGAKQDRFGCIEIKLHDQQKAAELAGRILGAFNDKLDLRTPDERAREEGINRVSTETTAAGAARAYAAMMG